MSIKNINDDLQIIYLENILNINDKNKYILLNLNVKYDIRKSLYNKYSIVCELDNVSKQKLKDIEKAVIDYIINNTIRLYNRVLTKDEIINSYKNKIINENNIRVNLPLIKGDFNTSFFDVNKKQKVITPLNIGEYINRGSNISIHIEPALWTNKKNLFGISLKAKSIKINYSSNTNNIYNCIFDE